MISKNRASVVNNVLITMAGTYGETALSLIASAIIARSLGPSDYGIYTYIIFIAGWMIKLSNISLPATVIRFVADSRGREDFSLSQHIAGTLLFRQTITSILVCIAFLITMQAYIPAVLSDQSNFLFISICIAVFFKARYALIVSIAKGHERFDIEAITTIIIGVATTILVIVIALTTADISSFVAVYTVTCFLLILGASQLCRRNKINYTRGPIEQGYLNKIHNYRRLAVLLGLVALMGGHTVEMFLLGQYGTAIHVGYFGLSIALTRGLHELCTAGLSTILLPRMAHAFGASNMKGVRNIFLESTRYYIFFGIGLGLSGFIISTPLILLIYGDEYTDAIWVLNALLLISGFGLASAAVGAFLSTTDRQDIRVKFAVAVLSVHSVLAITLVPMYGLTGAVTSSAVSTLFGTVLGFQWVARNLEAKIPYKLYLKLLASGLLALLLPLLATSQTQTLVIDILAAISFAILYLVLSIRLKCWGRADLDLVIHLIGLLPGPIGKPFRLVLNKFGV